MSEWREGEVEMRQSERSGALVLALIVLALESLGASLYLVEKLRGSSDEFCRGYAICV
jgi:hypothetical protein